jgi:hypothetical protein
MHPIIVVFTSMTWYLYKPFGLFFNLFINSCLSSPQRPVFRGACTNQKWCRIKSSVRFAKDNNDIPQLFFEHGIEAKEDQIYFAFTYPYTYTMLQEELNDIDLHHINDFANPDAIYYTRELLTYSGDGRRVDFLTISAMEGISKTEREKVFPGLFPEQNTASSTLSPRASKKSPGKGSTKLQTACDVIDRGRAYSFPQKEVLFISARVHPGEVPAQHTFKGILSLLLDPNDLTAKALRARYVFKMIPMLNPDGRCSRDD